MYTAKVRIAPSRTTGVNNSWARNLPVWSLGNSVLQCHDRSSLFLNQKKSRNFAGLVLLVFVAISTYVELLHDLWSLSPSAFYCPCDGCLWNIERAKPADSSRRFGSPYNARLERRLAYHRRPVWQRNLRFSSDGQEKWLFHEWTAATKWRAD